MAGANDDVHRLLAHFDDQGLHPVAGRRGWDHMGAVLTDAALQRRARYRRVVEPRVRRLMAEWPDARTVSGFAARLVTDDLGKVLLWRPGPKLALIRDLTNIMTELSIEDVTDLRHHLTGDLAAGTRDALRAIRGVGPKTVDYLAILARCDNAVAVDTHLRGFAAEAGLARTDYNSLVNTVRNAAEQRGWTPASVDAAIWHRMSSR